MQPKIAAIGFVLFLVSPAGLSYSQETGPAQPPAEAQIALEFKAAAPSLFRDWLKARPEQIRTRGLGVLEDMICSLGGVSSRDQYISFLQCEDSIPPAKYRIDVRKTDSILTPFEGLLIVPVEMTCTLNGAFPKAWKAEKKAALTAACVGASYEECLSAGAKRIKGMLQAMCNVGGLGAPFAYKGEEHVTYAWTEGAWQFQNQREEPKVRPSETSSKQATE